MVVGIPYIDTATGTLRYRGDTGTAAILAESDGYVHLIPFVQNFSANTGAQSAGTITFTSIGMLTFDPSILYDGDGKVTRRISFQAIMENTTGVTGSVRLVNLTDGVVVSTLGSSATGPTLLSSSLLSLGSGPGAIPNSNKIYDVQLAITAPLTPAISDRTICKLAQIVVQWVY